jgi:hypothetical protein
MAAADFAASTAELRALALEISVARMNVHG